MRKMTSEELKVIAREKNKRNLATSEAKYAQELIWERKIQIRERIVDDCEGLIDMYDEKFHEFLDYVELVDFIG